MFTLEAKAQHAVWFEGKFDGVWVRLPMEEWLPAQWESGYRWERAYDDAARLRPFLTYACDRSGADAVRVQLHTWMRRNGRATQPEHASKEWTKGQLRCR
jgi:hypothetical protein